MTPTKEAIAKRPSIEILSRIYIFQQAGKPSLLCKTLTNIKPVTSLQTYNKKRPTFP